jgi:tripeptidyl-peptidase I
MSPEEVIEFFAPHQSSVDIVIDWLVSSGIERHRVGQSVNKQWIQFDATAEEAETLLITDYYIWEHDSGARDISAEGYHVPLHIQEHIDYVTPGIRLRQKRSERANAIRKRGFKDNLNPKPLITKLPGFPHPNSTTCSIYVTAECTRGMQPHKPVCLVENVKLTPL